MYTYIAHKPLLTCLLAVFLGPFAAIHAQGPAQPAIACLEISGKVSYKDKEADNTCKVELICYNSVVDSAIIKHNKTFKFLLGRGAYYTIRISKKGYVTRWVSICTNMNVPADDDGFYRYHFDTDLIPDMEAKELDADALEFPIAIISFDTQAGWFYYNEAYTSNIKREIYKKTARP